MRKHVPACSWAADCACAVADYDLRCDNVFEHTPRRDQNSMDELSVLVSGHPDNRVYDRQFKACMLLHDGR